MLCVCNVLRKPTKMATIANEQLIYFPWIFLKSCLAASQSNRELSFAPLRQCKDVLRYIPFFLQIIASGWVVEPLLHNGQLYSMVTYLAQVGI